MLEVETSAAWPYTVTAEVAETVTKPSLRKHSLGGSINDTPLSNSRNAIFGDISFRRTMSGRRNNLDADRLQRVSYSLSKRHDLM